MPSSTPRRTRRRIIRPAATSRTKPITCCDPLLHDLPYVASRLGRSLSDLLTETDTGVRTHFARARVAEASDAANGRQPNIYSLKLAGFSIHFTDEPHALVVRGYSFGARGKRPEAMDGGQVYHCTSWHAPVNDGTN